MYTYTPLKVPWNTIYKHSYTYTPLAAFACLFLFPQNWYKLCSCNLKSILFVFAFQRKMRRKSLSVFWYEDKIWERWKVRMRKGGQRGGGSINNHPLSLRCSIHYQHQHQHPTFPSQPCLAHCKTASKTQNSQMAAGSLVDREKLKLFFKILELSFSCSEKPGNAWLNCVIFK